MAYRWFVLAMLGHTPITYQLTGSTGKDLKQ
jgi:hypothetical protein